MAGCHAHRSVCAFLRATHPTGLHRHSGRVYGDSLSRLVGQYGGVVCVSRRARGIRRRLRADLLGRYQLATTVPSIELRLTLAANLLAEGTPTAVQRAAANLESAERMAAQIQRMLWRQGNRAGTVPGQPAKPKESNEKRLARLARLKKLHETT